MRLKIRYSVFDIASYFLYKAQEDQELLSNLKLQKLVYYAQGLHLAAFNKPLFKEKIKAWIYGPVVPKLYSIYKDFGTKGISADPTFDPSSIDEKTRDFLDEVHEAFGQFSAIRLMELAHADQCWIDAGINNEITCEAMCKDLKKYIKDE